MRSICLAVVGLYLNIFGTFAQTTDSSNYKSRKLKLDEINFVTSYYTQDGNHSAVTGGTGTEALNDFSNNFEIKFLKYNKKQRKVEVDANVGVDYYTSASSDKIDPSTISSASHEDLRIYPSITRTATNEKKGNAIITGISYSHESDYESFGIAGGIINKTKDNNTELNIRGQIYFDNVKIILPSELRTPATGGLSGYPNEYDYPWKHRNTFSMSFSFSKICSQRLHLMWLLDLTYQEGFLSLPFHRIYFNDDNLSTERLPTTRFKIPVAMRANYFFGNRMVLRALYRFYKDDWGLDAHTADLETSFKWTPFFSVTPFYRYYTQSAMDFFAGYKKHEQREPYYTSNYDYSKFISHFFGGGLRLAPPKGLFGQKHWNMIEIRYGHYKRSNGLHADIISLNLKYK